jgi:pimeloyl-ACP methyl ester carboxylesterase
MASPHEGCACGMVGRSVGVWLGNRAPSIRLTIDAAFADDAVGARLSRDGVALIGYSMGGYTSLAVAGDRPIAGSYETADGEIRAVAVLSDQRARAMVLLAPACVWFRSDGALADVDVPIFMRTAEKGEIAPSLHIDVIKRGIRDPARVDHRVIPNAGHHAFQSPFPSAMTRPGFAPSRNPDGFDRTAFQPIQYADILSFLRRVL